MNKLTRLLGVCLILVFISLCAMKGWQSYFATETEPTNTTSSKAAEVRQAASPTYTVDSAGLDTIQEVINKYSNTLDISISLTDLQTNKTYHYGDTAAFTAASVGKLVTAAAFLHEVDKGSASLTQDIGGATAQEEIRLMLVDSDNTAWHNIKAAVTTEAQQAYADSIGLATYSASENTMSTDDVALLLTKLASGKLFADQYTQLMLGYMEQANY
ncbi:MAG TPA: serine hydrolase, partial [Candidatus Saccharimonadales bacterium]|nr:serine hydrolase [Candidatus Saccharimonadales bacterium]